MIGAIRPPITAVFVFAIIACAAVAGVVAIVLGIVAARRPSGRVPAVVGIVLGVGALAAAVVFTVLTLGAVAGGPVAQVELRAQGEGAFSVEYHDGRDQRTGSSADGDWTAMFGTRENATEMTVTADEPGEVSCQILRDGEVVAEETSDSGTVSCQFDGSR
ncbi:hypothetical protein [Microbacterium sp.]|uniref:hypothetical protein n=1 Tax=Microbacterium sp. TaxID=51671 RepID=UPI0039E58C5B